MFTTTKKETPRNRRKTTWHTCIESISKYQNWYLRWRSSMCYRLVLYISSLPIRFDTTRRFERFNTSSLLVVYIFTFTQDTRQSNKEQVSKNIKSKFCEPIFLVVFYFYIAVLFYLSYALKLVTVWRMCESVLWPYFQNVTEFLNFLCFLMETKLFRTQTNFCIDWLCWIENPLEHSFLTLAVVVVSN